jgi:hypothetical protein
VTRADQCDFCNKPAPDWTYPARPFRGRFHDPENTVAEPFGSDGGWAACDECHALIEAGDDEGLVEKTMRSPHSFVDLTDADPTWNAVRGSIVQLHQAFRSHRTGPAYHEHDGAHR